MLDYFEKEKDEVKEVIKRSVDELDIDVSKYGVAAWIPSKPEKVDKRSIELDDEEESIGVAQDNFIQERQGRFLNYVTIRGTETKTTTSTVTTTIGTVGITGGTSECASGSITDYIKKC